MTETKPVYLSKTFWLNLITALVMVLDLMQQQPFIPPQYLPWILFAVGVLNVVLRVWFTDTAIASKRAARVK